MKQMKIERAYFCLAATVCSLWLLFFVLSKNEAWSAEKIGPFKNVDQVIGWLKAKGQCKTETKVNDLTKCSAVIALPSKDPDGKLYSPGWKLSGEIAHRETKATKHVTVFVSRARRTRLSDKNADEVINIQKVTGYEFNSEGNLTQSTVKVLMKNFRGDEILNLDFPVAPRCVLISDDGLEDVSFLLLNFQFNWDWDKEVGVCQ